MLKQRNLFWRVMLYQLEAGTKARKDMHVVFISIYMTLVDDWAWSVFAGLLALFCVRRDELQITNPQFVPSNGIALHINQIFNGVYVFLWVAECMGTISLSGVYLLAEQFLKAWYSYLSCWTSFYSLVTWDPSLFQIVFCSHLLTSADHCLTLNLPAFSLLSQIYYSLQLFVIKLILTWKQNYNAGDCSMILQNFPSSNRFS